MADVTISSLPLGTPSGSIVLPYSSENSTYNATASAIVNSTFIEGSFTPAVIGTTNTGTCTYTLRSGKYIKIGNIVNFTLSLGWTGHNGSGAMLIDGLPFTNTGPNTILNLYIRNIGSLNAGYTPVAYVRLNEKRIGLEQILNAGPTYNSIAVSSEGIIYITGMYYLTF